MQTIVEDRRLPVDIDAQPVVQAAAALKPTLRHYQDEIEREQRLSPDRADVRGGLSAASPSGEIVVGETESAGNAACVHVYANGRQTERERGSGCGQRERSWLRQG